MNKDIVEYKNINFDDKYTPFLKGLEELKISNKGAFVLFAALGLKDDAIMNSQWKYYSAKGKGKELRSGTDTEYEPAVDVLICKLACVIGEHEPAEIFTSDELCNKYINYLMNIANLYCEKLVKEEFIEYKNGVSKNNRTGFVILTSSLIKKITDDEPAF